MQNLVRSSGASAAAGAACQACKTADDRRQHPAVQAFDPADRPTCEEALSDPYFHGLAQPQREPAAQPVSKLAFDFERRKLHTDEVGSGVGIYSSGAGGEHFLDSPCL